MRFFLGLFDPEGRGIPDTVQQTYEALPHSRGLKFEWRSVGRVPVLIGGDDTDGHPLVARDGEWGAAGTVRLDNRAELERWTHCRGQGLTDLELVLRTVVCHSTKYIPQVLGDFAFAAWNVASRTLVAACDVFAVKKLYYVERNGLFSFSSRGELLALEDRYDIQYLAELVAMSVMTPQLSPYAGVTRLPSGTIAVLEHQRLSVHRYWSAYDFEVEAAWVTSEAAAAEACRQLLAESVRLRLNGGSETWAQLSGGMDSSSVVSVAQWLVSCGTVANGLAGTVTYSDSHGTGADEREYSEAVATRWHMRNETIVDAPIWHDEEYALPHTDEPSLLMAYYPRDCRISNTVRSARGRVLLSGVGGDILFTGNMFFFADWVVRGRIWLAVTEMARRAALGRVSFWELAYRNALLPLLPVAVQHRLVEDVGQMPPWVSRATARRYGLNLRAFAPLSYAGPRGSKYRYAVAVGVAAMGSSLPTGIIEDTLDVRHPFLYRPLVEFALRLPPELCARPNARKWVLREAMKGILPDIVRTRVGKGVPFGLLAWSTATQEKLLEPLIREPILADLGVIDAAKLYAHFRAAQHQPDGRMKLPSAAQHTLAIEAWLQMRSGRWPRGATSGKLY